MEEAAGVEIPPGHPAERAGRVAWAVAVGGFLLLSAAWALADPLLSGPDEPAHLIRAEAIVRGDLVGRPVSKNPDDPYTVVRVPGFLEDANAFVYWCFIFYPDRTPRCAPGLTGPRRLVAVQTYVGHYPPLYYEAVGWPSLLDDGPTGVLWMRLTSALLSSLLLGTALWLGLRRSRLVALAVLVAATPTVLYYAGSVNPNGLEMTSAICCWCALLSLTMPWPSRGGTGAGGVDLPAGEPSRSGAAQPAGPGGVEIAAVAVSGSVLALSRSLSPAWLLVAAGAALLGGDQARLRLAARSTGVRVAAAVLALATAATVAWVVVEHGLDELGFPNRAGYGALLRQGLAATPHYLSEMAGLFGANNVPAPPFATTMVAISLGLLVLGALVVGSGRERAVLVLLLAAIVAIPLAVDVVTAHHYGLIWQGRYTLAVGVGSPLYAGYVLGAWFERQGTAKGALQRAGNRPPEAPGRALRLAAPGTGVLALGLGGGQFSSFWWDLRRFMVGGDGPLTGVFGGLWHPPVDGFVLLAAALCGLASVTLLLLRAPLGRRGGLLSPAAQAFQTRSGRRP